VVYVIILDHILSNGELKEEWLNVRDFQRNYLEKIAVTFRNLLEELQKTTKENPLRMDHDPLEIRNRHLPNTCVGNKKP
jgi:hypothetical protein